MRTPLIGFPARSAAALVAVAVALAPATADAQAPANNGAMQPVPNGLNVSVLRPTAINVVWTLRGGNPGQRIRSTVGLFKERNSGGQAGGFTACRQPTSASAGETMGVIDSTVTTTVGANGVARVLETLIISGVVADRALKRNLDTFFYCREFADPGGASVIGANLVVSNTVTCKQGSSAYANFSIARAEIFFDERRRTATVPVGSHDLHVIADVAYNGSGLIRAVWEVAELSNVGPAPGPSFAPTTVFESRNSQTFLPRSGFRLLHTMTQYVGFGDRIQITLPPTVRLPTELPGTFAVNLRFIEPPVGFEVPLAQYFVKPTERAVRQSPIALLAPAQSQTLPLGPFGFQWTPISGVSQYRLEVFPAEPGSAATSSGLIAGPATNPMNDASVFNRAPGDPGAERAAAVSAIVPSTMTSFNLRQGHFARLTAGRAYAWQVKGLDQHGNVVGESPIRQFTLAPR
jgi:hypothetical protein